MAKKSEAHESVKKTVNKLLKNMVELLQYLYNVIIFTNAGIRSRFWGLFLRKIGANCQIMTGVKIGSPFYVEIGNHVGINHHVELGGQFGLKIGDYVMIGPYSQILTANHRFDNPQIPMKLQGIDGGPIVIEDDVWIGAFVVILPNVKIGKGSIIGAHSVVTHNVEPYSIMGGVPAKLIKHRISKKISK